MYLKLVVSVVGRKEIIVLIEKRGFRIGGITSDRYGAQTTKGAEKQGLQRFDDGKHLNSNE